MCVGNTWKEKCKITFGCFLYEMWDSDMLYSSSKIIRGEELNHSHTRWWWPHISSIVRILGTGVPIEQTSRSRSRLASVSLCWRMRRRTGGDFSFPMLRFKHTQYTIRLSHSGVLFRPEHWWAALFYVPLWAIAHKLGAIGGAALTFILSGQSLFSLNLLKIGCFLKVFAN